MAPAGEIDTSAPDGVAEYCEAVWPRLVGGLAMHCGDRMVAEEIAQESLVRLWQHWDRISAGGSTDGWVWTVALNLSRSRLRRRSAERRARARMDHDRDNNDDERDSADALAVREAVRSLPDRQRTAVVLRFFADLSVADTAETMGCAEGTVSAHTHKALKSLGAALVDEAAEGGFHHG
jgi:RNA polymerase sigma-70 factor (sigma-E family)